MNASIGDRPQSVLRVVGTGGLTGVRNAQNAFSSGLKPEVTESAPRAPEGLAVVVAVSVFGQGAPIATHRRSATI